MELTPQTRIEEYLKAIIEGYAEATTYPYPAAPVWRIEEFLDAYISYIWEDGGHPRRPCPDPVWRIEECLRAIYDVMVGAATPWAFPTPTNRIETYLAAIHAYLADGTELDVPEPVWRIEAWLAGVMEAVKSGGGGTETTATGNLPLTLANALSHAILSLTRYGLCTQDGTPTPDAPVDILCNNGALRMVDDELPTGYKRLLGITFDGEVYYVTDYHMRGADTLRFSFKATETGRNVIGCYNGTDATDNLSFYFSTGSTGVYLRYNGGLYRPVAWTNTSYNCVISPTGVTGLSTDASWTEVDFTSAAALFIGWLDNASSPKFKGDMNGSIVVEGRANFIPVERQSDGAIGYWNGQAFLENQGTGTPVSLGYDGSHYQLSVDGTPEVLTVSGKNLFDPTKVLFGYYLDFTTGNKRTNHTNFMSSDDGYIPCLPNTAYTFVGTNKTNGTYSKYNTIYFFDSAKNYLGASGYQTGQPTTGTTPSNCRYLQVRSNPLDTYSVSIQDAFQRFNWQLELGSTATAYEPYVTPQTASVPMLLGVGDYKDEVELISGIKTGKVGIKVFDGTEAFTVSSSGAMITAISDVAVGAQNTPINTHFALETSPTSIAVGTQRFGASATVIYSANYYMKHTTITTVADFKTWLAAQYAAGTPVIVLYPLATETTEQTTAQHLSTHEGTNIVDSTANVGPVEAEVKYMGAS